MALLDDIIESLGKEDEDVKDKEKGQENKAPGEPDKKDPPKRKGPFNYCDAFNEAFGIK